MYIHPSSPNCPLSCTRKQNLLFFGLVPGFTFAVPAAAAAAASTRLAFPATSSKRVPPSLHPPPIYGLVSLLPLSISKNARTHAKTVVCGCFLPPSLSSPLLSPPPPKNPSNPSSLLLLLRHPSPSPPHRRGPSCSRGMHAHPLPSLRAIPPLQLLLLRLLLLLR